MLRPENVMKGQKMFLKRVDGPRAVTLPNGKRMTRADLPPRDTVRWVASRKAAVVKGVLSGLVSRDWAIQAYGLSEEELEGWIALAEDHGAIALRATAAQKFRQPKGE